jgi:hypothetical protein
MGYASCGGIPFNNLADPELEAQRLAALIAGVELGTVAGQGAAVVHVDVVARFGLAGAFDLERDVDLEAGGGDEGEKGGEDENEGEVEKGAHVGWCVERTVYIEGMYFEIEAEMRARANGGSGGC